MTYLYIDGPSLEQAVAEFAKELGVENVPFDHGLFITNLRAQRAFYYDALPAKKEGETEQHFDDRRTAKEAFFEKLNRYPRLHVRTGMSKWAKNRGQAQKAVDVLLAVDVITHAHNRTTESATIVTSDLDFQPVFNALLQSPVITSLY